VCWHNDKCHTKKDHDTESKCLEHKGAAWCKDRPNAVVTKETDDNKSTCDNKDDHKWCGCDADSGNRVCASSNITELKESAKEFCFLKAGNEGSTCALKAQDSHYQVFLDDANFYKTGVQENADEGCTGFDAGSMKWLEKAKFPTKKKFKEITCCKNGEDAEVVSRTRNLILTCLA